MSQYKFKTGDRVRVIDWVIRESRLELIEPEPKRSSYDQIRAEVNKMIDHLETNMPLGFKMLKLIDDAYYCGRQDATNDIEQKFGVIIKSEHDKCKEG